MSSGAAPEIVDAVAVGCLTSAETAKASAIIEKQESYTSTSDVEQYPTAEDWATLRRVYGKVDWMIYVIGIVEMCERFAYYGTTAVCKSTTRHGPHV